MRAARPQFDDALLDELARCYARAAVRAYIREMEAGLTQPEGDTDVVVDRSRENAPTLIEGRRRRPERVAG